MEKANALKAGIESKPVAEPSTEPFQEMEPAPQAGQKLEIEKQPIAQTCTLRLAGSIPPELWNRFGTKLLPKLRVGADLQVGVDFKVSLKADAARSVRGELNQILDDLGLTDKVIIEEAMP